VIEKISAAITPGADCFQCPQYGKKNSHQVNYFHNISPQIYSIFFFLAKLNITPIFQALGKSNNKLNTIRFYRVS
jgi:hypothetical protein